MTMSIRGMLACRWVTRRMQRFLDSDPAAPLSAAESHRIQAHLAVCARCSGRADQYRALGRELRRLSASRGPDPDLVARVREQAQRLIGDESD